ncbi:MULTISPECIES: hypothetical protein [Spirulina]|uniref:hypothetical protein n=2 Tax=Spirulinaceae TaxID=1890448 RepID=UPI0023313B8D|nr:MULTISPECIES: hypothetical protein [Spirulina]
MAMRLQSLFLTLGLASAGMAAIAPSAAAQLSTDTMNGAVYELADNHGDGISTDPSYYDPISALNLLYDLEEDGLTRSGFICNNNPSMDCGGEMYEVPEDHMIPMPDYMKDDLTSMECMNNVDPTCGNPRHYGVFYTDAPEELPPLTERTASLWAQLEQSLSDRPAPTAAPLPSTRPAPAPAAAPIPGLW